MNIVRSAMLLALSGLTLLPLATSAQAEHKWRPHFRVHLPQRVILPAWDDNDLMEEAEEDYLRSKRQRLRQRLREVRVWEDDFEDEDYEPVYAPPRKKQAVKKRSASSRSKPITRASVERYKSTKKPSTKVAARPAPKPKLAAKPVRKAEPVRVAKKKLLEPVRVASITPKPVVPSTPITKKVASAPPAPGSIAISCTRGTDIVTGYGFSAVSPKNCSGETFSFDAKRADKSYVITLSSATGEITDVKKIN